MIFAHHATYDTLHQVATLGLTAAAMGKEVIVILLFWTIKKLAEGKIDQVDFPPEYADSADEVARLISLSAGAIALSWWDPTSPEIAAGR